MFNNNCTQPKKTTTDKNRRLSLKQLFEFQDELNRIINTSWSASLSTDKFRTAIMSEAGEFLNDHSIQWKWWKATDASLFNKFGSDVEIVDIVHFYLSIMIIEYRNTVNVYDFDLTNTDEFIQFDNVYVGSDKGNAFQDVGLVHTPNILDHTNFMNIIRDIIDPSNDMYELVDRLDKMISAGDMTCEFFSAIYTAKHELNMFRQTAGYKDGTYVKVNDGIEDNDRLKPLVDAFMADTTMTLTTLRENVRDAFFELAA